MANEPLYTPHRGACILIPFNEVPHLFVSLNDPCPEDDHCLFVMLTSVKDRRAFDEACVFEGGEHPFIKQRTYVLYRLAETQPARRIINMVQKRYYVPKEDESDQMLTQIISGLEKSDETRMRIIRYAEKNDII